MRGIGFEIEEMVKLFLIFIIGLVVVILIIGASGGIKQMIDDFCAKNPAICGSDQGSNLNAAKASIDALAIGLNCVSDYSTCDCKPTCTINIDDYQESAQSSGSASATTSKISGFQTLKSRASKTIEIKCDAASCSITSFQLPQEISTAEEWIDGFGDPLYLIFWQRFPAGEDASWSSKSAWFTGTGKVMFGLMCASRVLTAIVFPSKMISKQTVTKQTVKDMIGDATSKTSGLISKLKNVKGSFPSLTRVEDDIYPGVVTYESGGVKASVVSWLKTAASKAIPSEKVLNSINSFKKVISSPYFKTGAQAGSYTALAAIGADQAMYLDERVGSELGKFINQPNQLVLQQALLSKSNVVKSIAVKPLDVEASVTDPQKQNIIKLGRPVMLDKTGTLDDSQPLYFASPCLADLKIEVKQVSCESYSYGNGETACEKPQTDKWYDDALKKLGLSNDKPKCGALITNIKQTTDVNFIYKEKDFINDMKSKQAFQSDALGVTIYDTINDITSHATLNPEIVCCESGNKKEWELKDNCVSFLQGKVMDDSQCGSSRPTNSVILDKISSKGKEKSITVRATDGTQGSTCAKVDSLSGIYKEILGADSNIYMCRFFEFSPAGYPEVRSGVYASMNPAKPNAAFIASLKTTGEIDKFYGILLDYMETGTTFARSYDRTIIFLKDNDGDGYIDEMAHYYVLISQTMDEMSAWWSQDFYRKFQDTNRDGKADSISSNKCSVDGITVYADKSAYRSYSPNFCYTRVSPTVAVGTTVGFFLVDAAAKRFPPAPWTFLASLGADCLLAYIDMTYVTVTWPNG